MMRTTILVCGDPARGDDGAPSVAIAPLRPRLPGSIRVSIVGQLEADDLRDALAAGTCLVLDTVRGPVPGSVIELPLVDVPASDDGWSSSHAVPLQATVAIARALGADLTRGRVIGIGGERFGIGDGLAPAVVANMDGYREAIVDAANREGHR